MARITGFILLTIAFATLSLSAAPAKVTVDSIYAQVEKNYNGIRDYRTDAEVNADIQNPRVHISKSRSTIYFKRPDKVKVVAKEGFSVMPDTFPGNPITAIKREFNAKYIGSAKIDGQDVYILNLAPKSGPINGAIAKLYVEKKRSLIHGMDINAGEGRISTRFVYSRVDGKYWLPSRINVRMESISQPMVGRHRHFQGKKGNVQQSKSTNGTTTITFSNYRVNKGIPDNIFAGKTNKR
jgi:outer membrane lipoprotein-sorting protein